MDSVIKDLRAYWDRNVEEYGDSTRAVEWGSRSSQRRRFEILCEILPRERPFSVLDVGSGLGDILDFIGIWHGQPWAYTGVDISPRMVELARAKHPDLIPSRNPVTFRVHDMAEPLGGRFDYVILSGTLNKRIGSEDEQYDWAYRVLGNCWLRARKGMAFNMLSTRAGELKVRSSFAYDPSRILGRCLGLTPRLVLRHDYMPHDFTVHMYRRGEA